MTSAEAWFSVALRPQTPYGSLGRKAQHCHFDFHTAPELWSESVCGLFGRYKAPTVNQSFFIVQELCESRGQSWAVRPNEPSGFRGRKAIVNHASALVSACP